MKLSTATTLLAHSLKNDHSVFIDGENRKFAAAGSWNIVDKALHDKLLKILKTTAMEPVRNPLVVEKGNTARRFKAKPKWGRLENQQTQVAAAEKAMDDLTECDPDVPDVGILACETARTCQPSELSELGGFCVSRDEEDLHRQLQTEAPSSSCDVADCSCDNFDAATGSGTITCAVYDDYELCSGIFASVTTDVSFANSELSVYKTCIFTSGLIETSICIGYSDYDATTELATSCYLELDGNRCMSCVVDEVALLSDADCSNIPNYEADTTAKEEILCDCESAEETFFVVCRANATSDGSDSGGNAEGGNAGSNGENAGGDDTGNVPNGENTGNVTDGDGNGGAPGSTGDEASNASKAFAPVTAVVGTLAFTAALVMAGTLN